MQISFLLLFQLLPLLTSSFLLTLAAECRSLSPSSVCSGIIDYQVYIPSGKTEQQLEHDFQPLTQLFLQAPLILACRESLARHVCEQIYFRCASVITVSSRRKQELGSRAVPRFPCRQQCEDTNRRCHSFIKKLPSPLQAAFDCNDLEQHALEIPSSQKAHDCHTYDLSQLTQIVHLSNLKCPKPLVFVDATTATQSAAGSCVAPCPSMLYTESEYKTANIFFIILSTLSWLAALFMLLTWSVFTVKRQQFMLLNFILCIFGVASALFFAVLIHPDSARTGCFNDTTIIEQQHGLNTCTVQSACLIFFTLAAILWWCCIAVDLYLKIVRNIKYSLHRQRMMNIVYSCCCWGVAALLWLIGIANQALGRGKTVLWCFINEAAASWVEWSIFYYPLMIVSVVGCYCMIHTLIVMIRSTAKQKRSTDNTTNTTVSTFAIMTTWQKLKWLVQYLRPIAFISNYLFIFSFILAYRLVSYFRRDHFTHSAQAFIHCLLTTPASERDAVCGTRPEHPPVILLFCVIVCVAGQGLLCFAIYGTQRSNFILWGGLCQGRGIHFTPSQLRNQQAQQEEVKAKLLKQQQQQEQQQHRFYTTPIQSSLRSQRVNSFNLQQLILTTPNMTQQTHLLLAIQQDTPSHNSSQHQQQQQHIFISHTLPTRPSSTRSSITHSLPPMSHHQQPFMTQWTAAQQQNEIQAESEAAAESEMQILKQQTSSVRRLQDEEEEKYAEQNEYDTRQKLSETQSINSNGEIQYVQSNSILKL